MSNSPISVSAVVPSAGDSPHSAMYEGRCVVRNAGWNPRAKNPPVSSAKPRSASERRASPGNPARPAG